MKLFLSFLAFCIAYEISGQSTERGQLFLGFSFSPNLCYRTLINKSTDSSQLADALIKERNESESIKPGYTTGLNIVYQINSNISIATGLHYSNIGYQSKVIQAKVLVPDPNIPTKFKSKYHFHFVEIPLKFNYIFNEAKFQMFGSFGINTQLFQKEMAVSIAYFSDHTERNRRETQYVYNAINISPSISAGINYPINERLKLSLEPIIRYGITNLIKAPISSHLYSVGINTGIYYKL